MNIHKHQRELKLSPGEIVPVEIKLLPSGASFEKGETLRSVIQGTPIQPDSALLNFVELGIKQGNTLIKSGGASTLCFCSRSFGVDPAVMIALPPGAIRLGACQPNSRLARARSEYSTVK
jgi:hypothetical protein